jgi:hypothetical protein
MVGCCRNTTNMRFRMWLNLNSFKGADALQNQLRLRFQSGKAFSWGVGSGLC